MREKFFFENMKLNGYREYVVKDGIIILDANALLNAYRYSKNNREKYFQILESVKDRLFLTYQSVQEFYNNRLTIISNKSKFKDDLKNEINNKIIELNNIVSNSNFQGNKKDSCNLIKYEQGLKDDIINILNETSRQIEEKINAYTIDINKTFINNNDPILDEILKLFEGKVNDQFKRDELGVIYKEGEERYKTDVPPGYMDKKKDKPDCFGDLVIWKEIISIAKREKQHVLFISDDRKEDWCKKFDEYDLGPRNELIKEFFEETEKYFHSITTKEFIKITSDLNNIEDTKELQKESEIIEEELIKSNLSNDFDCNCSKDDDYIIVKEYLTKIKLRSLFEKYKDNNIFNLLLRNATNSSDCVNDQTIATISESIHDDQMKYFVKEYLNNDTLKTWFRDYKKELRYIQLNKKLIPGTNTLKKNYEFNRCNKFESSIKPNKNKY